MITLADIKEELRIEESDTSEDARIQKVITRMQNFLKGHCNNENIDFSTASDLDEVVLYLCLMNLNPETSLRAGKTQESAGISTSYIDDLPKYLKRILIKYKRVRFV